MFEDITQFFDGLQHSPVVVQIALIFIVVSVSFTLLAYFSILWNRFKGFRHDRRRHKISPYIDELIATHILVNEATHGGQFGQYVSEVAAHFNTPVFRKKWARQILVTRIINYRKNVRGDIGEALRMLYLELGLDKDTLKKMRSGKWNRKVQALGEFVDMDVSIADVTLLPLTNSRNRELRAAARHAYIKLSRNEPFKFFDVVSEPLLMWDQIELFRIITTTDTIAIPNFARWITYSNNKTVVSFCLKLVVHYNQVAAVPAIVKLLDTKDHYLRADAIRALGKLEAEEVEDTLVFMYNNQPLICQIQILKALGRLKSRKHLEFLKREFLHASDFDIRKNAARSIVNMFPPDAPVLEELKGNAYGENLLILKHCMNPLIRH